MPNGSNSPWDEGDLAVRLRELWEQDDPQLSAGEIARQLGMSRNAVIGKARRLGLATRQSPVGWTGPRPEAWAIVRAAGEPRPAPPAKKRPARAPVPQEVEPVPTPVLRFVAPGAKDGCSWVHGDPKKSWRYCDAPRSPLGGSYCDEHRSVVYLALDKKTG